MLGSALIVFREVLEAALIVAIVMGAARGVAGRGRWVSSGVLAGIAGAGVVAMFAGVIADAMEGRGQEIFNALILIAAVLMLAWHVVWMSAHGKELAARMRQVGADVTAGRKPLSALALVTAFAVLREGSETVLFLYGLLASNAGVGQVLAGAAIGIGGGSVLGFAIYRGLLAIPMGKFFAITGGLVMLLASGLASNAAGYLNQAGLIPSLGFDIWDTSHILDQSSLPGMLLHILIGYTDRPMGIQLVTYLATLFTIFMAARIVERRAIAGRQAVQAGD